MHIQFQSDLLQSYGAVLDLVYSETLQQFYDPSDVVPEMLQVAKKAFKSKKLKSLNMTEHAFR